MDKYVLINIILVVVIVLIIMILFGYNKLIKKKNLVKKAESQIDVMLNKRFDLIPNIVECVKGYAKHESSTLEDVVKARNNYSEYEKHSLKETENVNKKLNNLIALAESYPNLKADTEFINLQNQLSRIESEIAYQREYYNDVVTSYNTCVESVPTNIIASMFNFKQIDLFKLDDDKRENTKVEL